MKQKKTVWEWMTTAVATVKTIIGIIPKNVKQYASQSLEITTRIKSVLDNPVTDIITAIIPTDWDDKAVSIMRAHIRRAVAYLAIINECGDKEDVNEMLVCWVSQLKQLHPDFQNAALHKLASVLTSYQDNEALRQRLYDLYVQMEYVNKKGDMGGDA